MLKIVVFLLLLVLQMGCHDMERADSAKHTNWPILSSTIRSIGLEIKPLYVYLRCFKKEELVQVWVSNDPYLDYKLIRNYSFCTSSGTLGPKRKEGDLQIPEGLYHVNRFNPFSQFHLSLGINYPNKADLVFANKADPGSDIFIHGECSSVGCIALGNKTIRELYTLAKESHDQGNPIKVDIFPYKFTKQNFSISEENEHHELWKQLQPFCVNFEHSYNLTPYTISDAGVYLPDTIE
jgi:murein L,D-transpeptidase YafK